MGKQEHAIMADTVRAAFRASGLSMKKLAERSNTHYASVHGFFGTCDRNPQLTTLEAWCRVLGLRLVAEKRKRR
ncbi:MAG: helix-turn-helix transcriptional regulator [Planctomycetes bacterium]|nr:helix-turn-helix transcriptional regulator [Planctomycetota bacterium]